MSYIHQMLVSRELGGAGIIALQLAAAMREQNKRVITWLPGEGAAAGRATELGIPWRLYRAEKALTASRLQSVVCNLRIAALLCSGIPGIVHVHSPVYYSALSLGLRTAGLKTVVHVHIEEDKAGLEWALRKPPDVIITCARFLAEYVRSVLPKERQNTQRIIPIPNAVDTQRFCPGDKFAAKARVGASSRLPLVLMVANMAAHKGHATALRAAATLKRRGVTAELWFAGVERGGGGEYTLRLQRMVQELSLVEQVKFLGQRNDIPDLLRAADFFVLPSTAEGLPMSILEAQASGVPVFAAPTAGVPELLVNGKTGYLIDSEDADGYAGRIYELLRNPNLYMKVAEQAHAAIVKDYSWRRYVERISDVYQTLTQ